MRRVPAFLTVLPFALLASGCVYALRTARAPTDVKLLVQAFHPQQYIVRVVVDSPADYPVGSDGRVQFTVPRFSNGCDVYVLGFIKARDGSGESVRLVELRRDARIVRRFSLAQISKLPRDEAGNSLIRVGD